MEQASHLGQGLSRLGGDGRELLGCGRGHAGDPKRCAVGLNGDHRHVVRHDVVQLPGDARPFCQQFRPRLLGHTALFGGDQPDLDLATTANGVARDRRNRDEHAHREQRAPPVSGREQRDEKRPGGQNFEAHRECGTTRCPEADHGEHDGNGQERGHRPWPRFGGGVRPGQRSRRQHRCQLCPPGGSGAARREDDGGGPGHGRHHRRAVAEVVMLRQVRSADDAERDGRRPQNAQSPPAARNGHRRPRQVVPHRPSAQGRQGPPPKVGRAGLHGGR